MRNRYVVLLTTLVFLGFTVSAFAKKPSSPPVNDSVVYTVELTGVYTIPAHEAHEVSLNSRGYLKSLETIPLVFERPSTNTNGKQDAWDAVIKDCAGFITDDPDDPMPMLVNFDDWAVGRNGDDGILWINFKNIRLPGSLVPEKEIQIHLRRVAGVAGNPTFLPAPGKSITHELDSYVVWGKPLIGKGKKGWDTCYHPDLESDVTFLPAELVITYIGVPE